jgi:hypothetical protein
MPFLFFLKVRYTEGVFFEERNMARRKRILKYARRVSILWKAFIRHQKKIGATYVTLDAEGKGFLEKCAGLQREFTRYHPHPENIRLLRVFESLLNPSGHPPDDGEPHIINAAAKDSVFSLPNEANESNGTIQARSRSIKRA